MNKEIKDSEQMDFGGAESFGDDDSGTVSQVSGGMPRPGGTVKLERKELPRKKEDEISELRQVIANLTEELKKRETELVAAEDKSLRAVAEADNFKKRIAREKEDFQRHAPAPIVEALIPAIDNMEKALQAAAGGGDMNALAQGLELIHRQIMETLKNHGLARVETLGKPMDPNTTEAIQMVDSTEADDGVVLTEFIPGYMFRDRVIRTAKVAVANNPAQAAAASGETGDPDIGAMD
ncbi:MAG: nucleotide exchange factor GrpE [Nitrospinae bacterium]|nr:nucleotide exchange factor GrpE [Nitrospinota bacterium]